MRAITILLSLLAGLALTGFVYQQAVVEGAFGPAAILGTTILSAALLLALGAVSLVLPRRRRC